MGLEFWNSIQDCVSIVLVLVVGTYKSTMYLLCSVQSSHLKLCFSLKVLEQKLILHYAELTGW